MIHSRLSNYLEWLHSRFEEQKWRSSSVQILRFHWPESWAGVCWFNCGQYTWVSSILSTDPLIKISKAKIWDKLLFKKPFPGISEMALVIEDWVQCQHFLFEWRNVLIHCSPRQLLLRLVLGLIPSFEGSLAVWPSIEDMSPRLLPTSAVLVS